MISDHVLMSFCLIYKITFISLTIGWHPDFNILGMATNTKFEAVWN